MGWVNRTRPAGARVVGVMVGAGTGWVYRTRPAGACVVGVMVGGLGLQDEARRGVRGGGGSGCAEVASLPTSGTLHGLQGAACQAPLSLEVSGRGCGLHTLPTRHGAHSSSGLQARSQTLGEPSLLLPVPTASGPRQTPSLPAPALGRLDACWPVCPAASLTGMSTAVLRGWAVCYGVGGGHLRGEGKPWAPRPPPLWHLPLCSSRRPMVRGRCGCLRIRTLWVPKSSICALQGADWATRRAEGLGAEESWMSPEGSC